jgi:hypothetical protein
VNYKYKKKGISLIVLIITIIVIIILAGGVILSLSGNNPINSANEAVFKSDLDAIESDLSLYLASQYTAVRAFNPDQLNANDLTTEYNGTVIAGKTIKDIIPALSTTSKYNGQFEVVNGKLVYLGTDRTKKRWAQEVNVDVVDADRLDAIISTTATLPISAGTDVVTTIKISSNASINNINLTSKLELLDKNNVLVPVQPVFEIAEPTGTELDTLRTVEIKIKTATLAEGIYKLRLKANCISNIYDVTNSVDIISSELFEIDNTPPMNPEMSVTPTGWTNLNVTISITYPSDSVTKEYSTDGSTWNVYTDSITVSNNNETIYARATDVAGNESSQSTITIANIDRESPTVTYGTNGGENLQEASTTVTVNDIGVSGIDLSSLRYIWDAQNVNEPTGEWTSFVNGEAISKLNSNGVYYLWIKAIDNTGNSVVTKSNSFTIDNTAPTNPTMSANPTGWTNGDVTVTIAYSVDTTIKEYSTDGTTWNTYTTGVIITTNNTTVYARGTDASGNQSSQSTLTVANIDKTMPTVVYGTNGGANLQTASTTVTASDLGGSNIASVQYIWDTQNTTTPSSGWVTFTNGSAITKTGVTGTYYLWVKALDNAGNTYITKSNAFGTDVTPPINPTMSASPTGWTNENVTVTITYPVDAVIKEYSTDGTIWSTYTSGVIVTTNNTTVYARATDASGNQSGQSTMTVANIDKAVPAIANALAGTGIYNDPTFASGINSTVVYNNTGDGTVTVNRIAIPSSPTGSGYGLEIKTTSGTPWPGWGGFYFGTPSSANKVFISKIIAKIPVGYSINWSTNAIGTDGNFVWLTSQEGTGNWTEYIGKVTCGSSGSFSTTNFYYITGGSTPTPASPAVWHVAYANVFDTTKWGTSNIVMASATEASGVIGYGINQSNSTAPTFTSITANTRFATVFDNITANGTYYVWLKDQAGNVTNSSVNVSYIDRIVPNITATNGGSNETSITVNATATDTGGSGLNSSSYQYSKDNGVTWTAATSSTSYTFTGLSIGIYQCKVKVSDNVGNVTTSNTVEIVTQGLVGKFSFSGSIINEVTNKTYIGTGTSYVTGRTGNGLRIDNYGQVRIPLSDLAINTNTNTVSVAFWYKWNGEQGIMPIGFYAYDSWINSQMFGFNTACNDIYGINNPFTIGTFSHVVLIFNKGDYNLNTIYINGVKQVLSQMQDFQGPGNAQFISSINISGWENTDSINYRWNGSAIDELRIYNRPLNDAEVIQIMNQ